VKAFLGLVQQSGLLDAQALARVAEEIELPAEPFACAEALVRAGLLTPFQAKQILTGRYRGLVLGPYRIERQLGKGGVGVVYQAHHTSLDRKVAIKALNPTHAREKLAMERFQREARAVAALDHPNIIRVHDVTQMGGVHFLVMEYVDGTDLQTLVMQTGRMHFGQAADYIAQAAAGLAHAHEKGFVHRDVKPANLMLTRDGTVKLLDLGLARSTVNPNDQLTGQIGDDHITGTVDFISPEQALNLHVDTRSDIYSLGATFFALLTGAPPYAGSTAQKLTQHQLAPTPELSKTRTDVPAKLEAVLRRMMAKKPSERYQSIADVIAALAPWTPVRTSDGKTAPALTSSGTTSRKLKRQQKAAKAARRKRLYIGGGVLAGLLIAGAFAALFSNKPNPTNSVAQNPPGAPGSGAPQPRPAPADPKAGTGGTKTTPGDTKPAPVQDAQRVYALDFAKVTPFTFTFQDGRHGDPNWQSKMPVGLYPHCWKKESVSVFRGEVFDGRPALGITNLNDDVSSQILVQFDAGLFRSGGEYRVRMEYRTLNDAEGRVYVRTLNNGESPSITDIALSGTSGQWRWGETTFRRPAEGGIDLCIVNNSVGEGNTLYFRRLEVFDTTPDKN
jgi:serine/threonine protein kinase